MGTTATYVYCLVAAKRRPPLARVPTGLPGTGAIRLLPLDVVDGRRPGRPRGGGGLRTWLVAADVPRSRYSEAAIARGLGDLEWVSRAAIAHEKVVESFSGAAAILPMKLFTIFDSDERALQDVAGRRSRIRALLKRVLGHDEWGVRLRVDRALTVGAGARGRRTQPVSGAAYLANKKAERERVAGRLGRSQAFATDLYRDLAARSASARQRSADDVPIGNGSVILDAAFLVPRSGAARFRASVVRQTRALPEGYRVLLTGPWPPYSFVSDD